MKSFSYITNKKITIDERFDVLQELSKWLHRNVPGRWSLRGNVINFEHEEDATLFLLIYTGNENIRVAQV